MDTIDWDNFEHDESYHGTLIRGIWEWGFLYKETQVPKRELIKRTHSSEPYRLLFN